MWPLASGLEPSSIFGLEELTRWWYQLDIRQLQCSIDLGATSAIYDCFVIDECADVTVI